MYFSEMQRSVKYHKLRFFEKACRDFFVSLPFHAERNAGPSEMRMSDIPFSDQTHLHFKHFFY